MPAAQLAEVAFPRQTLAVHERPQLRAGLRRKYFTRKLRRVSGRHE
jgi:hypothetical protein